jgi:hydroxymethylpyrimidine kinase/phosphomethylpyrimidine kinase
MAAAARRIRAAAGCAVLVKGGHAADSAAEDLLVCDEGEFVYSSPVVENPASTHGTGCSLSAAIAASLALGRSLPDAVAEGKAYVYEAIRTSLPVGPAATVLGMPDVPDLLRHPAISRRPA